MSGRWDTLGDRHCRIELKPGQSRLTADAQTYWQVRATLTSAHRPVPKGPTDARIQEDDDRGNTCDVTIRFPDQTWHNPRFFLRREKAANIGQSWHPPRRSAERPVGYAQTSDVSKAAIARVGSWACERGLVRNRTVFRWSSDVHDVLMARRRHARAIPPTEQDHNAQREKFLQVIWQVFWEGKTTRVGQIQLASAALIYRQSDE
jgi:hypothetical protein